MAFGSATKAARLSAVLPVLGTALAIIALDQATKWWAAAALGPGEPRHRFEILGRALAFHYAENTGAAFGMLRGQGWLLALFATAITLVLLGSVVRMAQPSALVLLGSGCLLGGALGNLIDRLRLGYVVDFIAVGTWPKFNVADSAITIGILLLAVPMLRAPEPDQKSSRVAMDSKP